INRKPEANATAALQATHPHSPALTRTHPHALVWHSKSEPTFMPEDSIHQPNEALSFSISESALERILRYIVNTAVSVPQLKERLTHIQTKPLRSQTMTIAEQLREEGKLEGKLEGQLRAFRTSVLRALEIRHGEYPDGVREAVEAIEDPQRLEALLESAIRSESIEAFAQKL
ncbi:MAG: hypothetical protein EBS01_16665, partial [Verrucomicrobia bacterium]|nr:hypothetical protein [Verrucomicrobiota bacterium]